MRSRSRRVGAIASSVVALMLVAATGASAADPCPNAAFRTGFGAQLPDCRAYEQVSPEQNQGNAAQPYQPNVGPRPGWTSSDGSNVLYAPVGPSADDVVRGAPFPQVAHRTAAGWTNRPAANGPTPGAQITGLTLSLGNQVLTADRTGFAFVSRLPFTADNTSGLVSRDPYNPTDSFYGVDLARGDRVDWVSRPAQGAPVPGGEQANSMVPVGGSDDLSTLYFASEAVLTDAERVSGRQNIGLYKWQNGTLTPAGVLPDGSLDHGGSSPANIVGVSTFAYYAYVSPVVNAFAHPVADDGKTLLFVSPAAGTDPKQLYLAREGRSTVQISKPANATGSVAGTQGISPAIAADTASTVAAAMSEDGHYVWFSTVDQLTPTAPADPAVTKSYRYDVHAGTLTYLPEVDYVGGATRWLYRTSFDGSHALFEGAGGALKISRVGQAPVTVADGFFDPSTGTTTPPAIDARFSRDGKVLVFTSPIALRGATGHADGTSQLYRYTEDDDRLECVSCGSADATDPGTAAISHWRINGANGSAERVEATTDSRALSDDGGTVFFDTPAALVPEDHNDVNDVYRWHDGTLRLVSSGAAPATAGLTGTGLGGSYFVDSSASGNDVFFTSFQGLVPGDHDSDYDLYDARVNGGFPPPSPPPAPCSGEACKPPANAMPATPVAGSVAFTGSGNLPASTKAKPSTKVAVATLKTVTGSAASLKVRVSTAGSIAVSGPSVKRVSRSAQKAATYTVRVALTAKAKRSLARHSALKVKVKVSFTSKAGATTSKTVTLSFKLAGRAR
jgi:hypothetical protein